MEIFIAVFILLLAIIAGSIFYFLKDKFSFEEEIEEANLPFKKKNFLMNIPERKFFEELRRVIPQNYEVFPQVILGSIVYPDSKYEYNKLRNKINRKTIDYVIFEKPYYKPVIAIEYNGRTHNYPNRIERDSEVKKILDSAGIKNFPVWHSNINFEAIKSKINEILLKVNS